MYILLSTLVYTHIVYITIYYRKLLDVFHLKENLRIRKLELVPIYAFRFVVIILQFRCVELD